MKSARRLVSLISFDIRGPHATACRRFLAITGTCLVMIAGLGLGNNAGAQSHSPQPGAADFLHGLSFGIVGGPSASPNEVKAPAAPNDPAAVEPPSLPRPSFDPGSGGLFLPSVQVSSGSSTQYFDVSLILAEQNPPRFQVTAVQPTTRVIYKNPILDVNTRTLIVKDLVIGVNAYSVNFEFHSASGLFEVRSVTLGPCVFMGGLWQVVEEGTLTCTITAPEGTQTVTIPVGGETATNVDQRDCYLEIPHRTGAASGNMVRLEGPLILESLPGLTLACSTNRVIVTGTVTEAKTFRLNLAGTAQCTIPELQASLDCTAQSTAVFSRP